MHLFIIWYCRVESLLLCVFPAPKLLDRTDNSQISHCFHYLNQFLSKSNGNHGFFIVVLSVIANIPSL
ncbi:hypothetical protein DERP_004280 [Dermatophagoides pteronyssinus]|uniref:Uncharacterized protein n=1 Tax=Dermatophagoides pteronyssinus TaxID=6956 RepID=A0ABQ8J939_DERPT|nr:hypothetical protein DERP_004280 [Dermatophagoides pteronyssinus]